MKIPKIMSLALLAVLCLPLLSSSSTLQLQTSGSTQASFIEGVDPVLPSPEPPHRILPISILFYSQFADHTPGEEVENMFTAINSTYGTDYYWTNLSVYTNLATELPNHDVLLIPEQELAYYANMTSVANAWSTTLTNWINDGGIVICADGRSLPEAGLTPTARILNETGLLTFSASTTAYPVTVNTVNASDALARGLPGSWTSASMTVNFDSPEETVVIDDGTFPIVIHKIVGKGHVVLIGFDYFSSDANMEMILANALRLHRHIVFDASHTQSNDIFTEWVDWANDLVTDGFAVSSMGTFDPSYFAASDVLVISSAGVTYSPGEVAEIEQFVAQGGGLFFIADIGSLLDEIRPVAFAFGFVLEGVSYLQDTDEFGSTPTYPIYGTGNLMNHSLTLGVASVQKFVGTGILAQPAHAETIIVTDVDGTADWLNGSAADGVVVMSAMTHLAGRVVVCGDFNWLRGAPQNADGDGTMDYFDEDNEVLAVNTIRWLSAAGIKERKVLFDSSHSPYWSFGNYLDFSNYLTSNGYTVHWMTTFYSNLVTTTDILVLIGGATAYSPAENVTIRNFVDNGGGLVLLVDWTFFGDNLLPVAQEFGMSHNNTAAYLSDSDDGTGGGNSGITYEGPNIGSHPITAGVNKIYVDRGTALINLGGGTALVIADNDGTSEWYDDSSLYWPAPSVPVFGANTFGLGRIVYLTDLNFFDSGVFIRDDNNLFLVNAFQWLAVNRAPVVTVTSPNGGEIIEGATNSITWTAQDPNRDSLTYDILYSVNGGGSWTPIATGHPSMSINWDASSVPESMDALIRVIAIDYELAGQDDSDMVFYVESEGPQISNIQTTPAIPLANLPVTVSADIIDASGVASAVCQVSIDGGSIWTDFPMTLAAGTTYEANIGVFASGTVEYRIFATDSSGAARTRTSPVSSFTIAALPPVIPGFPIEAIVLALAAGLGFIILVRRRRTVSS
jgi:hypothetical protein